jgi:hypothetical protein
MLFIGEGYYIFRCMNRPREKIEKKSCEMILKDKV